MTQDIFQVVIRAYLDARAKADPLFAESMKKPNKSIEGCANYIYNQVRKANRIGWDDAEIFGMAVHYYDEDDIKAEDLKPVTNVQTIINTKLEKPKTPKTETKNTDKAKKPVSTETKKAVVTKPVTPAKPTPQPQAKKPVESKQMDLFGDYNPFI